jgi:hypothetical protein
MPDSQREPADTTGGAELISFADMPARLEAAGLKRVSAQRCRQLAEQDPAWPVPMDAVKKVGRVRLFDWDALEPYFRSRQSRQGQRTDKSKPASKEQPMGYDQKRLLITARVSRHNSEQDQADDNLFAELTQQIEQLIADPRYADIEPDVSSY